MVRNDVPTTLGWMRGGQKYLAGVVANHSDDDLRSPSLLPDWTRAHVVAHLARNAEALGRLGARTGVESPMYADGEQRATDIESSARAPADVLRRELDVTARDLDAALDALDEAGWRAWVRSAQGRAIPATDIPWMRTREVWLHAVDLGAPIDALPARMVEVLLDDATGALSAREGCPAIRLESDDRPGTWQLGADSPDMVLRGPAAALAGWLVGRTDGAALAAHTAAGAPAAVPTAPRWI